MFLEEQIIIISEGSCNTEDWSNDAEHSALITGIVWLNYILQYIQKNQFYNFAKIIRYFWMYFEHSEKSRLTFKKIWVKKNRLDLKRFKKRIVYKKKNIFNDVWPT